MDDIKIKLKEGLQIRELGDENLLYDYEKKQVHVLNNTALEVFKCCLEQKSLNDITTYFVNKYEIDRETIEKDIMEIVEGFRKINLFCEN